MFNSTLKVENHYNRNSLWFVFNTISYMFLLTSLAHKEIVFSLIKEK